MWTARYYYRTQKWYNLLRLSIDIFTMKKIYKWIRYSSANPEKTSLTIKGVLLSAVPFLVSTSTGLCGVGFVCLGLDNGSLREIVDVISNLVFWIFASASAVGTLYGFARKVWLTAKGQNKALNS